MPKPITLSASYSDDATIIPNAFFDHYLPRANGEFLKIYLYLLRWLSQPDHALSLSGIADIFFMTENDVTRALKYWESEGLLRLSFDLDGSIASICLNSIPPSDSRASSSAVNSERIAVPAVSHQSGSSQNSNLTTAAPASDNRQPHSAQELHHFSESDDGAQLIFIIQQYLGRPLSPTDLNAIYYFYDELGFSRDLIEYLFEYCVSLSLIHI